MAYDGIIMAAIASELEDWYEARIERIFQPEAAMLVLLLHHAQQGKARLMLSANPRLPRVHLTTSKPSNPLAPPMFCMLLRKHLEGAKLLLVEQLGLERVLTLHFSGKDELGNQINYRMIAEIMGRHSNIVLVDPNNKVIDAIKRVPPAMSSVRILLPGITYEYPGHQERTDTLNINDNQDLQTALEDSKQNLGKTLVRRLTGFSPLLARELLARTHLAEDICPEQLTGAEWERLWQAIKAIKQMVYTAQFEPSLTDNDYAGLSLTHLAAERWPGSANSLVDKVTQQATDATDLLQAKQGLMSTIRQLLHKEERKLQKQQGDLSGMQQDLELRLAGELILANLQLIQPKTRSALLINYYEPNLPSVEVELDPSLNAVQNAQHYFKRYERARKGIPIVEQHIATTTQTLSYLQSLQDSLERAETVSLVREIEVEMQQNGVLPPEKRGSKRTVSQPSAPLHFLSPSGREILVGRSNLQNERLTRSADSEDWWLHTKDIPGSHVIIKGSDVPDETTLEMAAQLAAYYSKARQSSKVPVDYTRRKYVKKPGGSPPGYVIYTEQKTVLVDPVKYEPE